jgi:hypothetical protein
MGTVPSCEAILLEIQQAFGLNTLQTSQKKRFANLDKGLAEHHDMAVKILCGLFDALDFGHDPELLDDLMASAMEALQFHSAVENNLRTYGADAGQVAWLLLGHQFAPVLARKYAFWSLAAPVAPGMAGGDLWFVPRPSPADPTRLRLPIQTAVEWWLDLLGGTFEQIWEDKDADGKVRNLQNWRIGRLPTPAALDAAFEAERFRYFGTFADRPADPPETKFRDALAFVTEAKRLDAAALAREIPAVPLPLFEAALSRKADDGEKASFVAAVAERWQEPSRATVRRRFRLARAVQDCHVRLAELLNPSVKPSVADPTANKIVQVWALFEETYRLTVEADRNCRSEAESNARFAALVPRWLADGPLRSIMEVRPGAPEDFARWLSGRFREAGQELGDLFEGGDLKRGPAKPVVDEVEEGERRGLERMLHRLWNALEEGRQAEAEDLLRQVDSHTRREEFAADVLYLRGRHKLNANDTEGAKELFEAAFEGCRRGGSGRTRKIVAYACLGMAMAFDHFGERPERYFRVISTSLDPSELESHPHLEHEGVHGMETLFRDVSVEAAERFWASVYRPYPGVERMAPPAEAEYKALTEGFFAPFIDGDEEGLGAWVDHNRKLLETRIRDVRGDTFFGSLVKMANGVGRRLRLSPELGIEGADFVARLRKGLHALAGMLGSKAIDTPDFKRQTPLMLAADQGDARLVSVLLGRGVDVDAQDVKGRTALHSAAAVRSSECYLLILGKGADPTKRTADGLSALHSAVKFGLPDAVRATLGKWPERFRREEIEELLEMARHIHANYKNCRTEMAVMGRSLGPKPAYRMIAGALEGHLQCRPAESPNRDG